MIGNHADNKGDRAMMARLGYVLYWAGCLMTILVIALLAVHVHEMGKYENIFMLVVAGFFYVVGRACCYVLAGD
jgi:hypothetical protein